MSTTGRPWLTSGGRVSTSCSGLGQVGGGRSWLTGRIDVMTLQTLARRPDVAELTGGYGLVVVGECHHPPAAAFENTVAQIPERRWFGLTATLYRRDRLDASSA